MKSPRLSPHAPTRRRGRPERVSCYAGLSSLAFVAAACSGAERTEAVLDGGGYALVTTVFQPDGETSLLGLVDDPSAPGMFDAAQAIELGGAAALFGTDGRNVFAVGSSDAAILTRYELMAGGQLVERGALSLQPYGISSAFKRPELVPMLSDDKAYWIDDSTLQVVVWNPSDMSVSGTFSLAAAERGGRLLEVGEAVVRAGVVYVSASYRDDADGEAGKAVALIIDTATDSLVEVATDGRCGGTLDIAPGPDGALYFASNSFSASLFALRRPADYPAPCVLRIAAGERGFDAGYYVSMLDLADGRSAGQLVAGPEGRYYLLALHDELLDEPLGPDTELFGPYEASAWRWWSVSLEAAGSGELVPDAPAHSAANRVLSAGGRQYIASADTEAGTTTLMVPEADGTLGSGLEVTGYPYGLIQLR